MHPYFQMHQPPHFESKNRYLHQNSKQANMSPGFEGPQQVDGLNLEEQPEHEFQIERGTMLQWFEELNSQRMAQN